MIFSNFPILLVNARHKSERRRAMVETNFDVLDDKPNLISDIIISLACSIDVESFKWLLISSNDSKHVWRTVKLSSFDNRTSNGNIKSTVLFDLKFN